ncbi:MAG: hypothetical protein U0166_02105 [Acidobacteriota bacterium]
MDSTRFVALVEAFEQARAGNPARLKELGKGTDLPGFSIDDVIADPSGPRAGVAFRTLAHETCRGEESLEGCDVQEVRDALARLLKAPSNGCDPATVDAFLPPRYDGTQKGKGKLGAISWLSKVVHRGSPCPGSGIAFYIPTPEVPELFGELSPTEIKYDGSPDAKLVRRFYDFVEAMMIVGEGGYQLEDA